MTSQPSDSNQNLLTDNADTDVFFEHLEAIYNTPDASQGRTTGAQRSALAADNGEPTEDLSEEKLLDDVMRASALQQSGQTQEAIALYQQIYRRDREGHFGAIATKALESLGVTLADSTPNLGLTPLEPLTVTSLQNDKPPSNPVQKLLQGFYDRPLRTKQLIGLLTSEAASLIGLVGVGAILLVGGLRSQILEQAKSELAAAGVQYNIKINQMGFGFRGQSDNAIVINAAKAGQPSIRLQTVLRNEVNVRSIEFATLVDRQGRIIASANRNRRGEVFDPDKLVSQAMERNSQIKVTSRISWQELQKEGMVLPTGYKPGQDALIRYVVTPVRDPAANQKVIGALVAGDVVNRKWPIVLENTKLFKGGYTAIYLKQPNGSFELATSSYANQADQAMHIPLETVEFLNKAVAANGVTVTERFALRGETLSFAARTLPNAEGQPIAVMVRGTLEQSLNRLLQQSLATQGLTSLAVIALDILIALVLTRAIARPILRLRGSAEKLAEGDLTARAEVFAKDEVGQLAVTFNQMADSIAQQTATVEKLAEDQRQEAEKQRREAERLQRRVIELLTEIDGASQGDLTVRARVTDDEMGSIADAFNAALSSLQSLVLQVQEVSSQVRDGATVSDTSMGQLSQAADDQAAAIAFALSSIEQMASSIQAVAAASADAAAIARQASDAATAGGEAMEDTVESINELRTSVAETSKKVKRLTESSQEISKIVALISEISAKTNLLAFNASIEAVRAGEHGQGFRIVADEVRRLAEQVTTATKEIEQLVTGIQEETAEVLTMMEKGTSQVVKGSQLVANTRTTLSSLVEVSQQIDQLVQSISASTASQTETSQQVSYTMQSVAEVAQSTSSESQTVSKSLKQLLTVSQQLQSSVDRFRANKD